MPSRCRTGGVGEGGLSSLGIPVHGGEEGKEEVGRLVIAWNPCPWTTMCSIRGGAGGQDGVFEEVFGASNL